MRIGIDARELSGRATGVGRHLAGLLNGWAEEHSSRHEFVLFAHQPIALGLPANMSVRLLPGGGGTQWEQIRLPAQARREQLDVFFAPAYTAPLALRVPVVVLVHDLSFDTHPEWFRAREGLRRRLLTRWSSQKAAQILTVSETIREEILERYGVPARQVRCIYPGVTSIQPVHRLQRFREPLVLYVGSIFNRRNLPDLIGAFRAVSRRHPHARLEIIGDNRTHPRQDLDDLVRSFNLQASTVIRPFLSDEELADRYASAGAFAFLSDYEGFGHPPLEALSNGVPIVVLSTPVAHEVYGPAARYVQRGDLDDLARQLERLLFDSRARAEVLDEAPRVLARYSWTRAARETLDALESAASHG